MYQKGARLLASFFRKRFFLLGLLTILFGIRFFLFADVEKIEPAFSPTGIRISGQLYRLEIAETDAERAQGLGDRDTLCDNCGMLFIFADPGKYAFWMKDMRFPIDIIWLLGDRVVFVEHAVSPDFAGIVHPTAPADRVLELNANQGSGVRAGETVQFVYESF
ncbi:MAG: DUF192 domain-containing protein [Candidatus Moraniibacteriota bacterium]